MALFSRSFIRKRAIAAATTIVVSLASLALGHGPSPAHRHSLTNAQSASGWWQVSGEAASLRTTGLAAGLARPCSWHVNAGEAKMTPVWLAPLG